MKRVFDLVLGFLAFLITLPLYLFVIALIFFDDGFPVFISLPRVSEGKVVYVYKFRSMIRGAEQMKKDLEKYNERNDGPLFKMKNDPRLTRSGRILRKMRFDELPQLINVLQGRLSLVGPRPHEPEETERYPEEFKHIQFVKGGLTGLSQVSGASGLPFTKELELDRKYLENQSLWLDITILVKTVKLFFFDHTGV